MDRIEKINILDNLLEIYKIKSKHLEPLYIECNTLDIDLETELYRIISFDRLKETLQNKYLSMSKPKIWPDPYETFLMNNKARMKDGTIISFQHLRDRIYCQCWSLRKECDGLWNVHTKDYVKIKTTANKLMNYFYDTNNIFHYLTYFIGKVAYVSEDFISEMQKNGVGVYFNSIYSSYMAIIYSLLIKRKAFEYEDEVRLIFNVPNRDDIDYSTVINKWNLNSDYFYFKIDINDVIEEITFHPYLKEDKCKILENEIKSLGYNGKITHSTLYTREEIIVNY